MFVAIDSILLLFTHKHRDHETVSALSFLECANRTIRIENTEREHFLVDMTGYQLRTLYRNTTGQDITGTADIVVREMLATIAETSLVSSLAMLPDVLAQVDAVSDGLYQGRHFQYALGLKLPKPAGDFKTLHCKPLTPSVATECATRAPQRRKVATVPTAPAASATPAQPAQPKQARAFSVRPQIWELADRVWGAAGKPMDKDVVLKLRKEMMVQLEAIGIKKTSSSNELGNWMKERLAN